MSMFFRLLRDMSLKFFGLSFLCAALVGTLMLDVVVLNNHVSEISLTEFAQEGILLTIIFFFLRASVVSEAYRGFHILAAGFFGAMLCRELDALFDLIQHGAWLYPALGISLMALAFALLNLDDSVSGLHYFMQNKHFIAVLNGLVVVLIFSRLFGLSALWHHVLPIEYFREVKNIAEEGCELLGYELLLTGVVGYFRAFRQATKNVEGIEGAGADGANSIKYGAC